jgi:hypothetical protein
MEFRDIVAAIRKILERTRDSRGRDSFVNVEPHSYIDELLREFGFYYTASLAIARDWANWHAHVVADHESRLINDVEEDPHIRQALAESVAKHEALLERWREEERRIVDRINELERPFFST